MAIAQRNPNTVVLSRLEDLTLVNDCKVKGAATPGMLAMRVDDSDVLKWQVHNSADAVVPTAVFVEQIEWNEGIDDAYADGDLAKVAILKPGDTFWGIVPSGQTIAFAANLQSNGDGKLKVLGSGSGRFVSLSNPGLVAVDTRIRVEVL